MIRASHFTNHFPEVQIIEKTFTNIFRNSLTETTKAQFINFLIVLIYQDERKVETSRRGADKFKPSQHRLFNKTPGKLKINTS